VPAGVGQLIGAVGVGVIVVAGGVRCVGDGGGLASCTTIELGERDRLAGGSAAVAAVVATDLPGRSACYSQKGAQQRLQCCQKKGA